MRLPLFFLALALSTSAFAGDLKPLKRVEPQYPPDAARSGISGFVDLEIAVNAAGAVEEVSVTSAKPARVFERAAIAAVKKWEFSPGGGKAKVRLDFKL